MCRTEIGCALKFESFEKAHAPWLILDAEMGLRARTGGYDLLSIDTSDKLWIVFRTREKAHPVEIIGRLVVRPRVAATEIEHRPNGA